MHEDKTPMTHDAPWASRLRHRSDPNHVRTLQIPAEREFSPAGPQGEFLPSDAVSVRTERMGTLNDGARSPQSSETEPSYYDVPILQAPTWKWQIAAYFYLGGLSAGAYLISRAAEWFGGKRHR